MRFYDEDAAYSFVGNALTDGDLWVICEVLPDGTRGSKKALIRGAEAEAQETAEFFSETSGVTYEAFPVR